MSPQVLSSHPNINQPAIVGLLRHLSIFLVVVGIVVILLNRFLLQIEARPGAPFLVFIGLMALLFTHRQQVTRAARVICGGLLLTSVIGALATSGPLGFSWLAAPIAIMAAGWLLGQRVAMMLSFMGVAGVLAIYLLYAQGFSFDTHLLHEQAIALQIIALLLSARVGNAIAENFRKQWLEKARSQAHLQALFNSTDDLVWSVDPTHFGLLNYNTAFADYLTDSHGLVAQPGLSPAELFPDIVLLQKWGLLYRQALSLGTSLTSEGELFGDGLWVQVRLQVMNHEAECFGISVFARDMTYERDIERQR
ncbi:hypothetical protein FJZ55_04145, partial [Candidatus Woesearchaeota archaeon]|nr:hypothetical protein [Candidatus Woesearchaeota archaeon]